MLTEKIKKILSSARDTGWVVEPEAKRLFSLAGIDVPRFKWAHDQEEAARFAQDIGYPIVAKVISPRVIHKSEVGGVEVGIQDAKALGEAFSRLSKIDGCSGVLVEEMVSGIELIIGAKIDYQFGPVVLLGIGGTATEIYHDVSLRMAPLAPRDIESMVKCLKAHELLEGYRGKDPINLGELGRLLNKFSELVMALEKEIESIDLNPVMCSTTRCVVADARIMLKK
jgi:acetate---CoA ligase (ADP-forming) subunit beta